METSYGRSELLSFLSYLADKGLANSNTVQGLRVAVTKILADLSSDEEADIRRVNVALAMKRFQNKNPRALAPDSIGVYERRVASAISEFVAYQTGARGAGA